MAASREQQEIDLDYIRPDLAEVVERHEIGLDAARPQAVARRRKTGQRTSRENIAALCDPDSFVEYGPMVVAAQRQRRSLEDLIKNTPADGMLAGVGSINGELFDDERAQCIVLAYDYTVLAGTQGFKNHYKKDRMFELAEKWKRPVVFFAEGGGGRPGDTDWSSPAGLDVMAFHLWGRLSGLVPLVGVTSGRCFAGNAVILGCCDVIIATEGSNIGMGGPAMIEGGGLGVFRPEDVGPMDVQVPNGVWILRSRMRLRRWSWPSSICRISRARLPTGSAPTSVCCAASCPKTVCGCTKSGMSSTRWLTPTRCWKSGVTSAWAWSPPLPVSKGVQSALSPTIPSIWGRD